MLAVAALDNFEAGAVEAKRPFWHEQDALLIVLSQAATGGEARTAVRIDSHHDSLAG
jgi:hypothetical protein